jgi:hypothetical protein
MINNGIKTKRGVQTEFPHQQKMHLLVSKGEYGNDCLAPEKKDAE